MVLYLRNLIRLVFILLAFASTEPEGELLAESKATLPLKKASFSTPPPAEEPQNTFRTESKLLIGQEDGDTSATSGKGKGTWQILFYRQNGDKSTGYQNFKIFPAKNYQNVHVLE
jgi:hypothetical protein